jgi:hypothetical protein
MQYETSNGRKRSAENALDEPVSLEKSPKHRQAALYVPASSVNPSNYTQPRKVPAPGATQAAIARLSALKAQGRGPSPPLNSTTLVASNNDKAVSIQQQYTPPASAAPSGTKILAPGATQAALARLGSKNMTSINATATGNQRAGAVPVQTNVNVNDANGPRKVLAPGATQAALENLAALKNAGGYHHPVNHPALPPPPHPLFNSNRGGGGMTAYPTSASSAPTTAADFSHGTVVWAKMQSYPWWPAQVQHPNQDQIRLRHSSSDIFIVFYGTADYSWLPLSDLKLFRSNLPEYSKFAATRNKSLQRAIDQAWVSVGSARPDIMGKIV